MRRDYKKDPLKDGEIIDKQDLLYYYIEQNLSKLECSFIFNCSIPTVDKALKHHKILKDKQAIQKCKQNTNLNRYGCKHAAQNKEIQQKMKETTLKRYGVENYNQTEECKKLKQKLSLEKYGVDNVAKSKEIQEKIKQTTKLRYNVDNIFKLKDRIKQCIKEKYGVENNSQRQECKDKSKQTCLQKYGVEYCMQNKDIQKKVQQTNLKRYNCKCSSQNELVKQKMKDTCLKRYGVDNASKVPEFIDKIEETKSKNKSHTTSNIENNIYSLLKTKFNEVIRNYRHKLYPFKCDFYIPELDLFIEYQGTWTHGKEPFDPNNKEHQQQLKLWEHRSLHKVGHKEEGSAYYKSAINTWTKTDPLKRQTAKQNKLNWVEFFTFNDFLNWFNNLS